MAKSSTPISQPAESQQTEPDISSNTSTEAADTTDKPKRRYKSISRIDQLTKKTHGWYVRVVFKGTLHAKFFNDAAYGGKRRALSEALRFRNQLERELGKPRTNRTVVGQSPRTKTGIAGVRRTRKLTGRKGNKSYYSPVYEVTWSPEPNVLKRTSISIEKYGEEEAFRRACAIRIEKEREAYGSAVAPQDKANLSL